MRFEGPTLREILQANREVIPRDEDPAKFILGRTSEGASPHLEAPIPETINLETLEVLENDALDTFSRMAIALPHIVDNLKTLILRSTNPYDLLVTAEQMFRKILLQFTSLKTFVFTVGDFFEEADFLSLLYLHFPPNISTLRFRGPVSLAKSEHWMKWVEAFANPEYLPNLKKLSFVLDLADDYGGGVRMWRRANERELRDAKVACKQLFDRLESRKIVVEAFCDEWAVQTVYFHNVDERWEQIE